MKRILIPLALAVFAVSSSASAQTSQAAAKPSASTQAEAQVQKLWHAFKSNDKATLSGLLDDQFRMFEEGLSTFGDKKAEVNGPDEFELLNYTLSDFTVKPIGPNSALVTYVAQYEGKSGGETQKAKSVFGEVWTRAGDHWKILYLQETYVK